VDEVQEEGGRRTKAVIMADVDWFRLWCFLFCVLVVFVF